MGMAPIYQETVINWSTGNKFLEIATTEKKRINQ